MAKLIYAMLIGFVVFLLQYNAASAQVTEPSEGQKGVTIGGVWYLSFQQGEYRSGMDYSVFKVKRGYINIKKNITHWLSGRITPDVHQDKYGDYKVRLKYIYAKFSLPTYGVFYKPYIEWGLVHRVWLNFEEHINYYRMQDTMFLERNHLFNSADVGATFVTLLGGEMEKEYQQRVNKKYPGKYGSVALGIYNGAGYHAMEQNTNKVPEMRATLRPFPDVFPGLQLSYLGIYGKGNRADEPDWEVNAAFVSVESYRYVATGTYYTGKGTQSGDGNSAEKSGYSFFGELKFPIQQFSLIGRYDLFNSDTNAEYGQSKRIIIGAAYHFSGRNTVLLDYDWVQYENPVFQDSKRLQLTMEVHF